MGMGPFVEALDCGVPIESGSAGRVRPRVARRTAAARVSLTSPALAGVVLLVALAYPVRSFLLAPGTAWAVKVAWGAALALGAIAPGWGACALIASVPLVPILPYESSHVPHGVVHLIVLSQALPLLARSVSGRERLAPGPIAWGLFLLMAVACASAATFYYGLRLVFPSTLAFAGEVHRHLSYYVFARPGKDLENTLVAVSTLADGLLSYLVIRSAQSGISIALKVRLVGIGAVVVGALGTYQAWSGKGLRPTWALYDPGITRINATYSDPNALASYLALTIPILGGLAGAADGRRRLAWLATLTLPLSALIMTAGRMGYLATLIGLAVVAGGLVRYGVSANHDPKGDRTRLRRLLIAAASLLLAIVLALTAAGTARNVRHEDQTSYLHTLLYTFNLRSPLDDTLKGRLTIWRTADAMIREHPIFGIGVGTIYRQFPSYDKLVGGGFGTIGLSAHNTFLNTAAEMGAVGLITWIGVLVLVYATAFGRGSAEEASQHRWLRLGVAAGLVAFGVTMLTGDRTILREDVVMFFVVAAIASALAPKAPRLLRSARHVALWGVVLLALAWPARATLEARRIDLERVFWGLHAAEFDRGLNRFRWTTDHAILHIPGGASTLTLPVRSLAPYPQRLTVLLDGKLVDEMSFTDHAWHVSRYMLPRRRSKPRYHRLELRVFPAWTPPSDPRQLGVMVGQYSWTR